MLASHTDLAHSSLVLVSRVRNDRSPPRKLVLTVLGGFPIWQALRDKGQEEEEKLSKAQ